MKKLGNIRTFAVLLTPVPVTALVLAFVVMQPRTTALQAPGPTGQRAYGDGVYTVRLADTVDTAPSGCTVRLTGRGAPAPVPSPSPLPAPPQGSR
ncbi:hypothetical protein GCM10018780_06710 [Streptomyces lanatus]|nr:hypothetical protein GCM10018780_06710 [Streptomyces lanatus]